MGWGSLTKCLPQVIGGVHLHVLRAHPFSINVSACRYSVTVWADCVEILVTNALKDPLVTGYTTVTGGGGISARTHVHTALLYLRNGSADCVQIWCVGL